jgi:tetratricopeptide (TPR) repeat protein
MDPSLQLPICLSHIGFLDLTIQLLSALAYNKSPLNAEYLYQLGTAHLVNNDFAEAIAILQECLDIQSDHILCVINLATAFYCTDNMDHAKSLYECALSLEPSNIEAANNIALLSAQSGTKSEFELAEFKIKYAITCRSVESRLYLTYAEILMSVNDVDRAIDILFQGLKEVPYQESSDLNLKIGELFFLKNYDKTEAIEYYQLAIDINPRNLKARQLLQEALLIRENTVSDKESQFYEEERNRRPQSSQTHVMSSILKHSEGRNPLSGAGITSSTQAPALRAPLPDPNMCILQGMLEKEMQQGRGAYHEMYFELNGIALQWFLGGAEFTKNREYSSGHSQDSGERKDHMSPTSIPISDIVSISKVPGDSSFGFDIEVSNGYIHKFKSKSEHDTNTWLDALQLQCVSSGGSNNKQKSR